MGLEPEQLEKSNVSITGVNGKKLKAQTRQMCVCIVNTKTGTESWEKVYVHPEIKTSLLSKDCLIRLKVIDPKNFLDESEVEANVRKVSAQMMMARLGVNAPLKPIHLHLNRKHMRKYLIQYLHNVPNRKPI